MITRRTALKGAVAAALAAQPIRNASATMEEATPMAEKPQLFGQDLYGPTFPLALGETMAIPEAPEKPILMVEEISRRTLRTGGYMFVEEGDGAETLLRSRLLDESDRYCAEEWVGYKAQLRAVEQLLREAGVAADVVRKAITGLDESAVGLYVTGQSAMLDVGMDAGHVLTHSYRPSVLTLPRTRICEACGGQGRPCEACDSTGLADEPGPGLMLFIIPDGVSLEEAEPEDVAVAG